MAPGQFRGTSPAATVAWGRRKGETEVVRSLGYLAAVNVVIWVGLFLYLWRLDRRISEAERKP